MKWNEMKWNEMKWSKEEKKRKEKKRKEKKRNEKKRKEKKRKEKKRKERTSNNDNTITLLIIVLQKGHTIINRALGGELGRWLSVHKTS